MALGQVVDAHLVVQCQRVVAATPGSQWTLRWREMDSNF